MRKTHCRLCNKKVHEFLTHLYLKHSIKTVEEYGEKIVIKENQERKEAEYTQKVQDLLGQLNRKEITVEEYRSRMSTIKMG